MKNQNNPFRHKCKPGVSLVERTFDLEIEKAYSKLEELLLEKDCRIVGKNVPTFILVRQGSLWGISPVTAKKNINCRFDAIESGTRITCCSSLAADWKNLTIIGSSLAIIVTLLCLWISIDMDSLVATQQQSYWSWIATVNGYTDVQTAQMLADLTRTLAAFLAIILAAEVTIVVYVQFKINAFAEETLNALQFRRSK